MTPTQSANIERLKVAVALSHPTMNRITISRNLEKLQRIAVSLRKAYRSSAMNEKTAKLESRATELAREIEIGVFFFEASTEAPIQFEIDGVEYAIF